MIRLAQLSGSKYLTSYPLTNPGPLRDAAQTAGRMLIESRPDDLDARLLDRAARPGHASLDRCLPLAHRRPPSVRRPAVMATASNPERPAVRLPSPPTWRSPPTTSARC